MRYFWIRTSSFLIVAVLLVYWTVDSSLVSSYIMAVKEHQSMPVFQPSNPNAQLYEKIKKEAKKLTIPPIDARRDPVLQVIPGYNGREVDIEATLKNTLAKGDRDKIHWIYREIEPKKSLEDFGAIPIYQGNEQKKAAALMINVAWGTEFIDPMLRILKKKDVKATFFFDGSWLKENPAFAKKIHKAGHEIGNHAYSHPLMAQITTDRIIREVKRTEDLIYQTLHIHSKCFAPPAGSFDQRAVDVARRFKMKTILWTVDTIDWRKSSTPEIMVQRIEKKLKPGSLVLMHPTDRTVEALATIIDTIKKENLRLGTVSDVLSSKRIN